MSDHPFWHDLPELHPDLDRVRCRVLEEAATAGGEVGLALTEYVGRRGKMLRPGCVLLGSWAGPARRNGRVSDRIVGVAAAVETLHLATLIHDDVIDDSPTRRGEPSLHALYGRREAVLMGDYLLSRCFQMLGRGTSRENALRLASATGHIVRSELDQLSECSSPVLSRRSYLRRIAGKTALLFGLSLTTGAHESGARQGQIGQLARIGYSIGMAFQIIDDVLDFTADERLLGKPTASDLRIGLYTLPVIEAVERNPTLLDELRANDRNVVRIIENVRVSGGIAAAQRVAARYTDRARGTICRIAEPRLRHGLSVLTDKLLDRNC